MIISSYSGYGCVYIEQYLELLIRFFFIFYIQIDFFLLTAMTIIMSHRLKKLFQPSYLDFQSEGRGFKSQPCMWIFHQSVPVYFKYLYNIFFSVILVLKKILQKLLCSVYVCSSIKT